MSGKMNVTYFSSDRYDVNSALFEISAQAHTRSNSLLFSRAVSGLRIRSWKKTSDYVTPLQRTSCNYIMFSWMNFAVRELRICCPLRGYNWEN